MSKERAVGIAAVVALLLATMSLALRAGAQTSGKKAAPAPVGITGTWEAGGQPKGPWLFNLQARGDVVSGRVWQEKGLSRPAEIFDGRINGDTLSFKYRTPRDVSRLELEFPGLISPGIAARPNADLTITLTGLLKKDEIQFRSDVANPNGTPGTQSAFLARSDAMRGLFDPFIAKQFTVKRADTALTGRVVVEDGLPRPVFRFQLVNAAGKRFDPVTRGNTWEGVISSVAVTSLTGSAFDVVPRSPSVRTVLGNPASFIVRLPAGEYRSAVSGLPVGYVLKSIVAVDRNLATESLRIMADLAPPEVTITLGAAPGTSWARVSGRVTNVATRAAERGGQFRGGANSSLRPTAVLLISKEFSEHWFAPLGPDGAFEFPRVLPHSYELRVFPDSAVTPALKLNVTPSANMTNLQIVAPDVKTIPCPNC